MEKQPDYSITYKVVLLAYSSISGLIGLLFILTIFSVIKINTNFSFGLGLFLIFTSLLGLIAFFVKNKNFKLFNGYLRAIEMVICILLLYTCIKYVKPSDEFQRDFLGKFIEALMFDDSSKIDDVQNALHCCGSNYTVFNELNNSINLKNIKLKLNSLDNIDYFEKANVDHFNERLSNKFKQFNEPLNFNQLKSSKNIHQFKKQSSNNIDQLKSSRNSNDEVNINYVRSKSINLFDDLIPDIPKVNDLKYKLYFKHNADDNPKDDLKYPKSCCPKLNERNECTYKNIYNVTCNLAYEFKVYSYKVTTIIVLLSAFAFEFSLLYMFKKDIHLFNSN